MRKIGIACILLALLCVLIGLSLPAGDAAATVAIGGFIFLTIGIVVLMHAPQWEAVATNVRSAATLSQFGSLDQDNGVLTLHRRGEELASILKIKDDHNAYITYTPVKVHIGAVSVGGVTTGGIYTTGGDRVYNSYSSGYYILEVNGTMIRTIRLSDDLRSQAVSSPISEFLSGWDIVVVQNQRLSSAEAQFLAGGEANLMAAMATGMLKQGYPSKEKCLKIMDWLTTTQAIPGVDDWVCKSCGMRNPKHIGTCPGCGATK